jgi:CRP-like cAMP-binding protein
MSRDARHSRRMLACGGYPPVEMNDLTTRLASLPTFAQLDERSLQAVAALAREVALPAGTVLIREGAAADAFYVIVSGTVHVERAGALVRSMSAGGFLGEIGLLEDRGRSATVVCATDCELVELGAHEFSRVMATFPEVRARIEAAAARRPHATD